MKQLPKNTRTIIIVTHPYGWNVVEERAAEDKSEFFHYPDDVCMCEYCASDPHYGYHYCKRYVEENERFYPDHVSRW